MYGMLYGGVVTIFIADVTGVILIVTIILIAMHEDGGGVFMETARAAKPRPPSSSHASRLGTLWG